MRAPFNATVTQYSFSPPGGPYTPTGLTGQGRIVPQGPIANGDGGIALSAEWITSDTLFGVPAWSLVFSFGVVVADGSGVGILEVSTRPGEYWLVAQTQLVTPYGGTPYYRYLVIAWL